MLYTKVTDFVPYIDNNLSLFLNKKDINITGIDNNKNKEYIVQNLLTKVEKGIYNVYTIGGKLLVLI